MPKAPLSAYLALLAGVTLWASSFVALKIGFRIYDPMVIIFGRMLVASLCFLVVMKRFRKVQYQTGDWKLLLFMGVCEPGFYFVFESLALMHTDASQAGMICAMNPILIAIPAAFILKEKVSGRTIMGFVMAIGGAILLSLAAEPSETAPNPALGNFFEFLAMLCATGYIITLKRLSPRYGPWFLTMVQAAVGTIFFFPLLFLPGTQLPTTLDPVGIGCIIYLGVFITLGAYGLYNVGISQVPANQGSAFINLIPVITLVISWLVLKEQLTAVQYVASALVLLGVWTSQDPKSRIS